MTIVPWTVLEPGQTETIAGVLLGREHPQSVHLRPARGDGGIDILDPVGDGRVDVYQVKYFPTALTDSRKDQIRRSMRRLAGNPRVEVRKWYLVLPLNPSADEHEWFERYLHKCGVTGEWFGLSKLEGLAAAHQDVIDYYVRDGRERLEKSIEQLRKLAGIVPGPSSLLVAPSDVTGPLAALYEVLNRDDPHFRYDSEVGAEPPPAALLLSRPGLIASVSAIQDGVSVTHHVHAKFEAATDYRPIPLTFNVRRNRMDGAVAAEWDRAIQYGTPVTLPTGTVTDLAFGLPGGLGSTAAEGSLWVSANRNDAAKPYKLRLRVLGESDEIVGETLLDMERVTLGMSGRGIRAHGHDVGGALEVEILTDIEPDGTPGQVSLKLTLSELTSLAPAAVRAGVRFISAFHRPHRLQTAPEYGPPAEGTTMIEVDEPAVTDELVDLVDALADLQERVKGDLRVPDLGSLTMRSFKEITRTGRLVRGETIRESWEGRTFSAILTGEPAAAPDGPVRFAFSGRQDVAVGDQVVTLDPITMVLMAAELAYEPCDGGTRVTAVPALGNTTMVTCLASIDEVPLEAV